MTRIKNAALGRDPESTTEYKYGFNGSVGVSLETVWDGSSLYAYPAAATVMKVSSSSTDDTSVDGTGARTVHVFGLDANYNQIDEVVSITGQTSVNTTKSYLRVYRARVVTVGSGGVNAGDVHVGVGTVTNGVPATKYATISAGEGSTLMAVYTVAAGHKALIWGQSYGSSASQSVTVSLVTRGVGESFRTRDKKVIVAQQESDAHAVPIVVNEKSDIEVRAIATSGGDVSASIEMELVDIRGGES